MGCRAMDMAGRYRTPAVVVGRARGGIAPGATAHPHHPRSSAVEMLPTPSPLDALLPPEMAEKAEEVGAAKCSLPPDKLLVLGVLAGAFIALGGIFSTVVVTGAEPALGFGPTRLLAGVVFSLGLILVVVAGAELFTGNNLIVMAWAGGRTTTGALLRNWFWVYVGNAFGAVATAELVVASGILSMGDGSVGQTAAAIAGAKCSLPWLEAFTRGVLCNGLVCLAVWLSLSARSTTDRVLCVVPPIAAFVACGFEHSVANLFFVPLVLLAGSGDDSVTVGAFLLGNLVPVTLGNIAGGAGLVGAIYWFVYRRDKARG